MITFDESTKELVLQMLNKAVDDDGYIYDVETRERALTPEGSEVHIDEFAGIRRGSEIFITKDLPSLLKYAGSETAR